MNQDVAINHLNFMKIQFQEVDQAILEPKREAEMRNSEADRPSITLVGVFQQPWIKNSVKFKNSEVQKKKTRQMSERTKFLAHLEAEYGTPQKSHHRNPVADQEDRKPYHYFNIVEDEAPPSRDQSEVSQTPEEPSNRKRSREEDEEGNVKDDNMSHIPSRSREVRLSTPFTTIADMAFGIREELNCRKTLQKRNQANENYYVVCLNHRIDSGFCDYMHNNQHDRFIKYWHAMFGTKRVNKQNLLLQFQEMMKVRDVFPKLSTAYYQGSR
ncbi:hypothetical protein B9Z55_026013 [Caenorhabditis nigoni]|uniref:Uncharacterized protein n=1 Tax=Caenorhabditis nigoni TaxID=1611254 RepID=A0A2G5T1Q6_9PELO|nr:hypothetical protein B9Z55_026013 [Caenorhabditis nigoni]